MLAPFGCWSERKRLVDDSWFFFFVLFVVFLLAFTVVTGQAPTHTKDRAFVAFVAKGVVLVLSFVLSLSLSHTRGARVLGYWAEGEVERSCSGLWLASWLLLSSVLSAGLLSRAHSSKVEKLCLHVSSLRKQQEQLNAVEQRHRSLAYPSLAYPQKLERANHLQTKLLPSFEA